MAFEAPRTSAKPRRRTQSSGLIHPAGERRTTERRIVHERCSVYGSHDEAAFEGVATDISKTGLGLIASTCIPVGSWISIVLSGTKFEVELRAEVIWCAPLPTTNRVLKDNPMTWRMGLKFHPQNPDEKSVILLLAVSL